MSWVGFSLAGFEVIIYGRFWVITEALERAKPGAEEPGGLENKGGAI